MSRRSSRRIPAKKAASLPTGITTGLASLVEGNESVIAKMLSVEVLPTKNTAEARTQLLTSLTDCMAVNHLSAEALLARFFDAAMLRAYCERRLGASGKGHEATLAARIARAWSKTRFEARPLAEAEEAARSAEAKKPQANDEKATKRKDEKEREGSGTSKRQKKKSPWCAAMVTPSSFVQAPPGPLGITIKGYGGEFVVTDVSEACPVSTGPSRIRYGDIILTIDGSKVDSANDIHKGSERSREIGIGARTISINAADHSRGKLLQMKESGCAMFRMMDYSNVAEKYGEEFLHELEPPNKGKTGHQILAGAWSSLGKS